MTDMNINIPKDLVEAVIFLINAGGSFSLAYNNLEEFKSNDPVKYHHSTGRKIRNEWGLWGQNSELYMWFCSVDISHPDDMSGIILTTLHRILNKKPVKLAEQVKEYQKYWEIHNEKS